MCERGSSQSLNSWKRQPLYWWLVRFVHGPQLIMIWNEDLSIYRKPEHHKYQTELMHLFKASSCCRNPAWNPAKYEEFFFPRKDVIHSADSGRCFSHLLNAEADSFEGRFIPREGLLWYFHNCTNFSWIIPLEGHFNLLPMLNRGYTSTSPRWPSPIRAPPTFWAALVIFGHLAEWG